MALSNRIADPRDGISIAKVTEHALPDLHQSPVTDLMAQTIVDRLEPVDIDEQNGKKPAGPARLLGALVQVSSEQHAIGQSGQDIVVSNVFELGLMAFGLADV